LHYYAVKELLACLQDDPDATVAEMAQALSGPRQRQWVNLGGQLVAGPDVDALNEAIRTGRLDSWQGVHGEYDRLWSEYPQARLRHALATLLELLGVEHITGEAWADALDQAVDIQKYVSEQTFLTRQKDDENPFRQITFDSPEQMRAVLGSADDNSFITQVRRETEEFAQQAEQAKQRT